MTSGTTSRRVASKRTLSVVSRTVESMAPTVGDDAVLIGLFQRGAYFAPVAERYRRLAATGAAVMAAYAGPGPRPDGVEVVDLHPEEPLAAQWCVVLLTPGASASLVAIDLESLDPDEHELELGRRFDARWGFDRHVAAGEARRLAQEMGSRMQPATVARIRSAAAAADAAPLSVAEVSLAAALQIVSERVDALDRQVDSLRRGFEPQRTTHDPLTGLANRGFLDAWLGGPPTTDLPTPPIGLALVDLDGFREVNDTLGHVVGDRLLTAVADVLRAELRQGDVAVRWGADEFVVLIPGLDLDGVDAVGRRLIEAIATVNVHGRAASASVAVTVARRRPLPLAELRDELLAGRALGPAQLRRIGDHDAFGPLGDGDVPTGAAHTRPSTEHPERTGGPRADDGARPHTRRRPAGLGITG
ncbi:MAG TPA: diguanylate cyclase [Acidimicrobiales bacterium]|nr:diguanylate cyclase [Acidimicrobiales bacterium]